MKRSLFILIFVSCLNQMIYSQGDAFKKHIKGTNGVEISSMIGSGHEDKINITNSYGLCLAYSRFLTNDLYIDAAILYEELYKRSYYLEKWGLGGRISISHKLFDLLDVFYFNAVCQFDYLRQNKVFYRSYNPYSEFIQVNEDKLGAKLGLTLEIYLARDVAITATIARRILGEGMLAKDYRHGNLGFKFLF